MDHIITLPTDDGHTIPLYHWPSDQPKAVIHISHGLSEHAGRYNILAESLNKAGFDVFAHNHRGHGQTAEVPGLFAPKRGWDKVVDDMDIITQHIHQQHPDKPLFMVGHSMGSYILQSYLIGYSPNIAGCVLSGSNFPPQAILYFGHLLAKLERYRQGKSGNSPLIDALVFGPYRRAFKPVRTRFDWLSRDPDTVDQYIADPLCGQPVTNKLWYDLLGGLKQITSVKALNHINHQLPTLVLGGTHDPVSAPAKPAHKNKQHKLAKALQKAGLKDVTLKLYADGRHEIFNEINREQVVADLIEWLQSRIQ